jgi:hypothetical protein
LPQCASHLARQEAPDAIFRNISFCPPPRRTIAVATIRASGSISALSPLSGPAYRRLFDSTSAVGLH